MSRRRRFTRKWPSQQAMENAMRVEAEAEAALAAKHEQTKERWYLAITVVLIVAMFSFGGYLLYDNYFDFHHTGLTMLGGGLVLAGLIFTSAVLIAYSDDPEATAEAFTTGVVIGLATNAIVSNAIRNDNNSY